QGELQPFAGNKMNEMHFHALPWPVQVLEELGQADVILKATLSYFIEPSPGRRGWSYRHRYSSYSLRFDVKTPEESPSQFMKRVNRAIEEEEEDQTRSRSDSGAWYLGSNLQKKGSIHSDWWKGSAAQLAQRNQVAVYPVIGWWRERHQLGRSEKKARYTLLVSIKTPAIDVDIYTPILNQIAAEVPVLI
ncbi:MAG: hypothetical protein C4523_00950, partial [Myxococcales bacterium]